MNSTEKFRARINRAKAKPDFKIRVVLVRAETVAIMEVMETLRPGATQDRKTALCGVYGLLDAAMDNAEKFADFETAQTSLFEAKELVALAARL